MSASSQNPPEALPAGLTPVPSPMPADVRAAYANYGITFPLGHPGPVPSAPAVPEVTTLAAAAQASPEVSPAQAAAALLDAELDRAIETGEEVTGVRLAAVDESAGILFDPQRAQDIAAAARAQVRDEYAADIAERGRQLAMLSDHNRALRERVGKLERAVDAVLHLVEGRPDTDLLTVSEVLAAADGKPFSGAPLVIRWDGLVMGPSGDTDGENTLVPCTTARGGSAALVLDDEQRQKLASLLDMQVRDINAACTTPGCGEAAAAELSDLFGWSRLEIASLGDGPRWYCSDMCVFDALARAGHELAAADRQAAVDPEAQAPGPLYGGDVDQFIGDAYDSLADQDADVVAACVRCGCTENSPCQGGCAWVPNAGLVDLCSACATPEELAAVSWKVAPAEGGGQ